MDLRRRLLATLVGAALAASLTACADVRGGLPEDDAAVLQREVQDVQEAVTGERCDAIEGQVRQVNERLDNLPTSVSDRLEQSLRDGVVRLRDTAVEACNALANPEVQEPVAPTTTEETPTTEEPAPEEPTETETQTQEEPAPEEPTETETQEEPMPAPEETPTQPEGATPAPEGDGG